MLATVQYTQTYLGTRSFYCIAPGKSEDASADGAFSWTANSTVQGPIHKSLQNLGLHSLYCDIAYFNGKGETQFICLKKHFRFAFSIEVCDVAIQ
jgi:hypothetical protein